MADVPVKSVRKALAILSILAFEDPAFSGITLKEIARRTKSPANSVHNLLKTMAACQYVAQRPDGRYTTGPRCRQIGLLNGLASHQKAEHIDPLLQEMAQKLNEAAVMTVLCGGRRLLVGHVDSSQMVKIDKSMFEDYSIYELPTGRVLIAHAGDRELEEVVNCYGYPGELWDGARTMPELIALRQKLRRRAYCVVDDEKLGLWMAAVPVLDRKTESVGALGVYAPRFRCTRKKQQEIIRTLKEFKTRIHLG